MKKPDNCHECGNKKLMYVGIVNEVSSSWCGTCGSMHFSKRHPTNEDIESGTTRFEHVEPSANIHKPSECEKCGYPDSSRHPNHEMDKTPGYCNKCSTIHKFGTACARSVRMQAK